MDILQFTGLFSITNSLIWLNGICLYAQSSFFGPVPVSQLVSIDDTGLLLTHFLRNQMALDGICMDAVVDFREFTLGCPAYLLLLFSLQSLELLDEVQFEFHRHPVGKLKGNVRTGIGATIATGLRDKPNCIGSFNPLSGRQGEGIQSGLAPKPLEFEGVKIGVV